MLGRIVIAAGWAAAVVGCGNSASSQLGRRADPAGAAGAALAAYDKDGDGAINKAELAAAPGLAAGAGRIDADGNGSLSRAEIEDKFRGNCAHGGWSPERADRLLAAIPGFFDRRPDLEPLRG